MGDLIDLLTSFGGCITRAQWWLGLVIVAVANIAGGLVLNPDFFTAEELPPSWPDTLWQIALVWPMTAITVKRFHDTDRPWWIGFLFAPLGVAAYLGSHLLKAAGGTDPASLLTIMLPLLAYFLLAFIDNGFFRGTPGPNRFGPDPLAGKAA